MALGAFLAANPEIGAAAITTAGNLLGGIGNLFGINSSNSQSMKLARYQEEANIRMWNMNNEYNKPVNQMARLKEAGLNPNLVYGSGAVAGNSASAPQGFQAFKPNIRDYSFLSTIAQNAMNLALQKQELKNKRQEEKNMQAVEEKTRNESASVLASSQQTMWKTQDIQNQIAWRNQLNNLVAEGYVYDNELKAYEKAWRGSAYEEKLRQLYQQGQINDAKLRSIIAQTSKINAETRNILLNVPILQQTLLNLQAQGKLVSAQQFATEVGAIAKGFFPGGINSYLGGVSARAGGAYSEALNKLVAKYNHE